MNAKYKGLRINRIVLGDIFRSPTISTKYYYSYTCDCGNIGRICTTFVLKTKGLGCEKCCSLRGWKKTNHGLTDTRIGRIWTAIKSRCQNSKNKSYKNYGGRGITICNEWMNLLNFHNWAVENGYDDSLTIDRIDNNGNYEPSNCRWATSKEQSRNKRNSCFYFFDGKNATISEWSEIVGLPATCIDQRIRVLKWSFEKAITTPILIIKKSAS